MKLNRDFESERLRAVQERLRMLRDRSDDQNTARNLSELVHEIGLVRLALDTPDETEMRQHIRVNHEVATAIRIDGREADAVISNLSIGGVALNVDQSLPVGTALEISLPSIGWVQAEVVGAQDLKLNVRFHANSVADENATNRDQALLDFIERQYD